MSVALPFSPSCVIVDGCEMEKKMWIMDLLPGHRNFDKIGQVTIDTLTNCIEEVVSLHDNLERSIGFDSLIHHLSKVRFIKSLIQLHFLTISLSMAKTRVPFEVLYQRRDRYFCRYRFNSDHTLRCSLLNSTCYRCWRSPRVILGLTYRLLQQVPNVEELVVDLHNKY